MESTLVPCEPSSPPAPWLGGKRRLAKRIIDRLAATPHVTYVEPFLGMGGVFLRRPFRAQAEVVNDASRDVANLFRILQRHYVPLMDILRWQVTSRADFERLRAAVSDTLTDLVRAARFLYLQRTAFGGKIEGRSFGVSPTTPGRFDVIRLGEVLEDVRERLSGVVIECLPYQDLLPRYDRPETLFYLDPPYWGCKADYGTGLFAPADFERLAALLGGLSGSFLLSLNDRPEVRALFGRFRIEAVEVPYGISKRDGHGLWAGELLISGGPGGSLP